MRDQVGPIIIERSSDQASDPPGTRERPPEFYEIDSVNAEACMEYTSHP